MRIASILMWIALLFANEVAFSQQAFFNSYEELKDTKT